MAVRSAGGQGAQSEGGASVTGFVDALVGRGEDAVGAYSDQRLRLVAGDSAGLLPGGFVVGDAADCHLTARRPARAAAQPESREYLGVGARRGAGLVEELSDGVDDRSVVACPLLPSNPAGRQRLREGSFIRRVRA